MKRINILLILLTVSFSFYGLRELRSNIHTIQVGNHKMKVDVANNPLKIAKGMMFKRSMPEDFDGMLFILDEPQIARFWMKNTYIPLDIAFIDETHQIKDIQSMFIINSETEYVSPVPVKYVLEAPLGYLKNQGIQVNDFITLDSKVLKK